MTHDEEVEELSRRRKKRMKPSERIQELVEEEDKRKPAKSVPDAIDIVLNSIVKYLDEQHEQAQREKDT